MNGISNRPFDLDPDFGMGGVADVNPPEASWSTPRGVGLDEAGRMTVAMSLGLGDGTTWRYGLSRIDSSGALDVSFGDKGFTIGSYAENTNADALRMSQMRDGRTLIVGRSAGRA
jgi:hypothetical protein